MAALSIHHHEANASEQYQQQTPAIGHAAPESAFEPANTRQTSSLFDSSAAFARTSTLSRDAAEPAAGSSLFDSSTAFPKTSTPSPDAAEPTANQLQFRVAVALASGKSVTAAAGEAGLHRSTIHKWLDKSPTFKHLFETARRDYAETLRDSLRDLSALALRTIQDLMTDPKTPPSVRLRAALAVLTRPQFPKPGWNLPEQIEPDYQRELQDKLAAVQADYNVMRMSRALAASAPLASVHHKSTESDAFAGISGAQPARNALCPCGSGKKYKRCCGQSAPPVLSGFRML